MRPILFLIASLIWHTSPGAWGKTADTEVDLRPVSFCPATSINFITQSLPQQCLRTSWAGPGSTASAKDKITASGEKCPDETAAVEKLGEKTIDLGDTQAKDNASTGVDSDVVKNFANNDDKSNEATGLLAEPSGQQEEDGDPLGDQSKFLSFEDWKAQMLAKADRNRDYITGEVHGGEGTGQIRKRQPGIENGLDSLGDEGEIELDFSGFVTSETTPNSPKDARGSSNHGANSRDSEQVRPPTKKSKEAGTTSKERFNYASFDCAATVLKTNQGSKGATWILSENKDSYLLNKCSQKDKYFIVEMCNDILIDTIVLGNFEFFSSTFRHFRVSISDRYPVKAEKWREIGTFEARNERGVQAFMIENGLTWVRYLKVELLTHYGKEYYCPVSLLRVHGKTMFDDIRHEVKESNEQDEGDDEEDIPAGNEEQIETVIALSAIHGIENEAVLSPEHSETEAPTALSAGLTSNVESQPVRQKSQVVEASVREALVSSQGLDIQQDNGIQTAETTGEATERTTIHKTETPVMIDTSPSVDAQISKSQILVASQMEETAPASGGFAETTTAIDSNNETETTYSSSISALTDNTTTFTSFSPSFIPGSEKIDTASTESTTLPDMWRQSESEISLATEDSMTIQVDTTIASAYVTSSGARQTDLATSMSSKSKSTKSPTPIKAAPASVPATQDSFFRSVHRRLQMLESNSSLSLQYIEEQSRSLRDAFVKAEKRQLLRTSNFLETLNSTVLGELRSFRIQYDQIWQSTVIELASQREQSQNEVRALGERLGILADELVWQKRVVYLQFVLIVLCLGLVIFSRNGVAGASAAPFELNFLQSIQHLKRRDGTSVSFAKRYSSFLDSPLATPSRPDSMGGFFDGRKRDHRRHLSDGITSGEDTSFGTGFTASPDARPLSRRRIPPQNGDYPITSEGDPSSPTIILRPTDDSSSHSHNDDGDKNDSVPEADPSALKRAASSPVLRRMTQRGLDDTEIDSACDDDTDQTKFQVPGIAETLSSEHKEEIELQN